MKRLFLFVLLLFSIFFPMVYSLGVATEYLVDNTLSLNPGESFLFELNLQNNEDYDVKAEIILNSKIAEIVGSNIIDIPAKNYDTYVYLNVTLPKDAKPEQSYSVDYLVKPIIENSNDISLNLQISKNFKVISLEEPPKISLEKPENLFYIAPVVIVIMGLLVVLLYKRSKLLTQVLVKEKKEIKNLKEKIEEKEKESEGSFFPLPRKEIKQKKQQIYRELAELKKEEDMLKEAENFIKQEHKHKKIRKLVKKKKSRKKKTPVPLAPEKYFYLNNGKVITNIQELVFMLKIMNNDTFMHHVRLDKNDFSAWIDHVLGNRKLAEKILNKSRKEIIEILENEEN